jgi:predicted nucleic acid-binding Zn ribbon protein
LFLWQSSRLSSLVTHRSTPFCSAGSQQSQQMSSRTGSLHSERRREREQRTKFVVRNVFVKNTMLQVVESRILYRIEIRRTR